MPRMLRISSSVMLRETARSIPGRGSLPISSGLSTSLVDSAAGTRSLLDTRFELRLPASSPGASSGYPSRHPRLWTRCPLAGHNLDSAAPR